MIIFLILLGNFVKIYLSKLNESWVVDRFRADWYLNNPGLSTENLKKRILFGLFLHGPGIKYQKTPKKKKVVCSIIILISKALMKKKSKNFINEISMYIHTM